MTSIEWRLEKAERSLVPEGSFAEVLITLGGYEKAEEARFDVEQDESGARVRRERPDPGRVLARAAEEAERAHEVAMIRWIESMPPRRRAEFLKGIGGAA